MELRVLRYFLAVARAENITAAAQALHVTQPTLSKQLMDLEQELGTTLFIRGSRKTILTKEGMFLRKRAEEILDLADKTETEFKTAGELVGGDIFIGSGETEAMRYVAKTMYRLQQKYPNIRLHLHSGNGEDVADRLEKGLLDFGLFVGTADLKRYHYLKLPLSDTWGLLLPKDHSLAALDGITPGQLKKVPLICSRQALHQNEMSGWLGDDFAKLNIVASYNLIYNASLMVEEGIGAALCISGLINTTGSNLCFRPLEPEISAGLVLAWKKYRVLSQAAEMFLNQFILEVQ